MSRVFFVCFLFFRSVFPSMFLGFTLSLLCVCVFSWTGRPASPPPRRGHSAWLAVAAIQRTPAPVNTAEVGEPLDEDKSSNYPSLLGEY